VGIGIKMEKEKKTVLLTGATGFIGSAVLKEFISSGYHVIVLLRSLSNTKRLNGLKGFESVIYENLNDENLIRELRIKKPSIFLQMAWSGVSGKYRNELFQIRDNLSLTINSVELAVATGCTHWIGIGSQAEYGNQNRRVNEKSPIEPTTIYGKIKVACCWAALGLCHAHNLKGTWLRLFDPYGPGDNPTWFIPYLIKEMLRF
jgi:nucleoside-diphosphate-sugar epimerase